MRKTPIKASGFGGVAGEKCGGAEGECRSIDGRTRRFGIVYDRSLVENRCTWRLLRVIERRARLWRARFGPRIVGHYELLPNVTRWASGPVAITRGSDD